MKKYQLTVLIEQEEGGVCVAKVPPLRVCHTQGKTLEEALERIREAADLCLEVEKEDFVPTRFCWSPTNRGRCMSRSRPR